MEQSHPVTGENIRRLLHEKRRSQADLARTLGVAQATISQKLSGARPLKATELTQIADFLDVTPGELFTTHPQATATR
ncbi:helix-turn-helix domain-containing protein [Serinibacter salmoneus]|uniref:DNA-binding Xre family transcriptional regulator n=1 Tax=Serinibacter salmoneus TaxID=556530 RepID=A0A2A9CZH5_9MICO|nr:helix-turn-helix transcriptional regulator [Serinibacter salmoneus]PFG19837.1 DNA-binding Xre family transcriptional regulator [Serinibacter salmoneus]